MNDSEQQVIDRHQAGVPAGTIAAARAWSNDACVDCGADPRIDMAGGLRCHRCYMAKAQPKRDALPLAMLDMPGEWVERAACAGIPTDVFFPEPGPSPDLAYATCKSCPVRTECLSHALSAPERQGVWGGMSAHDRKELRTGRRAKCLAPKCQRYASDGAWCGRHVALVRRAA